MLDSGMAAKLGPPCGRPSDLAVPDAYICAFPNEEFDHRLMAIERGIVQTRGGIIETSRDVIDLCALLEKEFCRRNVAVHAGIYECVVHQALVIISPRSKFLRQLPLAGLV